MSVFHCGEKKLHPGELNNRERRIAINKLTSEISKMEREIQLKKDTGQKINELLSQQIEQTILKENSSAYTTPGRLRNWGLFLESPDNFSGPESYFMCAMFALKTQILLALKAEQ